MGPLQTSNKEQFNMGLQKYKYLHRLKWFWNGHLIYCLDNKKKIGNIWWTGKCKSCRGVTLPMLKLAASLELRAASIIWLLTLQTGCYLQKPIAGLYAACWRNLIRDGCRPGGALCCFDHFTLQPSLHSNQMTSQCFLNIFLSIKSYTAARWNKQGSNVEGGSSGSLHGFPPFCVHISIFLSVFLNLIQDSPRYDNYSFR